jgi:hypothetical protein
MQLHTVLPHGAPLQSNGRWSDAGARTRRTAAARHGDGQGAGRTAVGREAVCVGLPACRRRRRVELHLQVRGGSGGRSTRPAASTPPTLSVVGAFLLLPPTLSVVGAFLLLPPTLSVVGAFLLLPPTLSVVGAFLLLPPTQPGTQQLSTPSPLARPPSLQLTSANVCCVCRTAGWATLGFHAWLNVQQCRLPTWARWLPPWAQGGGQPVA